MAFDYKKEYKAFYLPPVQPGIITVPAMNFVAVRGSGDPNTEDSEYKTSIQLLYSIAFTIKMSKMGSHRIDGYFDYVVPPLEGLWWSEKGEVDYRTKTDFRFISMIRLPDFVTKADFDWAIAEATRKKKMDFSKVEFFTYEDGPCVQCMHIGPYDDEPATLRAMKDHAESQGFRVDLDGDRHHHEIYLSDPRKTAPARLRTVIRLPLAQENVSYPVENQ